MEVGILFGNCFRKMVLGFYWMLRDVNLWDREGLILLGFIFLVFIGVYKVILLFLFLLRVISFFSLDFCVFIFGGALRVKIILYINIVDVDYRGLDFVK